jgi:hypothetical protein
VLPVLVLSSCQGFVEGGRRVSGYREADSGFRGVTVNGRVALLGLSPKSEPLPVMRDDEYCGTEVPNEAVLVAIDGSHGIDGAVVSIEGVQSGRSLPRDQTLVIESRGCRFVPRVSATVVGSLLAIQSTDAIMHNTHVRWDTRFGDTVLNVIQPAGSPGVRRRLNRPGAYDVRCDIHPFMRASLYVFEHPYFAVTDSGGRFEIGHVPPGTYRLVVRHEVLGVREKLITVPEQGPLTVDVELELKRTSR